MLALKDRYKCYEGGALFFAAASGAPLTRLSSRERKVLRWGNLSHCVSIQTPAAGLAHGLSGVKGLGRQGAHIDAGVLQAWVTPSEVIVQKPLQNYIRLSCKTLLQLFRGSPLPLPGKIGGTCWVRPVAELQDPTPVDLCCDILRVQA